jgi:hypothetical protein
MGAEDSIQSTDGSEHGRLGSALGLCRNSQVCLVRPNTYRLLIIQGFYKTILIHDFPKLFKLLGLIRKVL